MFPILQIAVLTSLVAYLCQRRTYMRRRNLETWNTLSAQLQRYPHESSTPWARFQNARIVLEMADYIEFHGSPASDAPDKAAIVSIRTDAMSTRLSFAATMLRTCFTGRKG